jgi:glycosyltransferase involved in cell wall biosynthesis
LTFFKSQQIDTICLALEGGGAWADHFIAASDLLWICSGNNKYTWQALRSYIEAKELFVSCHLINPTEWCVNNIPSCLDIYATLHSEPSEHEIVDSSTLCKIEQRVRKLYFPAQSTLECYASLLGNHGRFQSEKLSVAHNRLPMVTKNTATNRIDSTTVFSVAVVSRVDEDKFSLELFIAVARLAKRSGLPLRITVAGSGDLWDVLNERVAEEDLGEIVELPGFVHDVDSLYMSSHLVLLPSKRESMPYVMLEAQAFQRPIVLPAIGFVSSEAPAPGIFIFPPGDADAAFSIMLRVRQILIDGTPIFPANSTDTTGIWQSETADAYHLGCQTNFQGRGARTEAQRK